VTILGAGFAPAGFSPAGYGVPSQATAPNNALLPSTVTSLPQTGRYIDPVAKSYTFTADGRLQGAPTVQQLVTLAFETTQGSSAIQALGSTFRNVKEQGSNFVQQLTAIANNTLAALIKAKLVALVNVVVLQPPSNPDGVIVRVFYKDLTTGTVSPYDIGP
jgi:hypothetical protein